MELSTQDVQDLIDCFAQIIETRQTEKDIAVDVADSDLTVAQEATDDKIDAFKALVAAKIQQGGITILQEGAASRTTDPTVTMPLSFNCTC